MLALLSLVRNNGLALKLVFAVMSLGLVLLEVATVLLKLDLISGLSWMILIGLGSYLTYVPFGSVLFDRILAHTRFTGTAVFGIYLADAMGYTGSVLVQLTSDFATKAGTRLQFFSDFSQLLAVGGAALMVISCLPVAG